VTSIEQVTPRAARLLAPNPGPMTLDGTNTWVLREPGFDECVVVDPGPLHDDHLTRVAEQGPVALIVLTHGHFDHAEGAARLRELTGAPVVARDPALCVDATPLEGDSADQTASVEWLTVLTPGHSSDSVCFLLRGDRALLTGDTVLGRGTTVVAYPDGKLAVHSAIDLDEPGRLDALGRVAYILVGNNQHTIEALPDRAAMSLVNANLAVPVNLGLAANVLSDNSTAYADAVQGTPITQGI